MLSAQHDTLRIAPPTQHDMTPYPQVKDEELEGDVAPRGKATRPDEMKAEVLEFINAIDDYKRLHTRPFPTWTEVFDIFMSLGYRRG